MALLKDRKLFVDGKPVLVLSEMVRCFRLERGDWHDRAQKAKQAGCNAIANYIPWRFHPETEGRIDVTRTRRRECDPIALLLDHKAESDVFFSDRFSGKRVRRRSKVRR